MTAISKNRGRRAVRTTLAVGAVSLGLVALSACSKPSPSAHFTLGSHSKTLETASDCYAHGGALGLEASVACMEDTSDVPVFDTHMGDTFRIGVDASVAHHGWLLFVNGNIETVDPSDLTYRSFDADRLYAMSQGPGTRTAEQNPYDGVVQVTVAQVSDDYDVEELLAAYEAAQPDNAGDFEAALFGTFQGVWNVQLEPQQTF